VAEPHHVGRMERDASGAVGVRERHLAAIEAISPRTPAERLAQLLSDVVLERLAGHAPHHHRRDVGRRRRVRVSLSRSAPEDGAERRLVEIADVLSGRGRERDHLALPDPRRLPFAVIAGGHAEKLAQRDVGAARVVERKRLGQILLGEDFGVQPVGDRVPVLGQHDAAGDAGERLAAGGHVGIGVAERPSGIFLVDQVPAPHDDQPRVLGAPLGLLPRLVELGEIHPRDVADRARLLQRPPAPRAVGRGIVVLGQGRAEDQRREQVHLQSPRPSSSRRRRAACGP